MAAVGSAGGLAVCHYKKHFLYEFGTWWIESNADGDFISGEGEVVWTSVISQYRETSKKLLLESLLYHPL